jgi:peptide/nickel transport system substrate-binding protein
MKSRLIAAAVIACAVVFVSASSAARGSRTATIPLVRVGFTGTFPSLDFSRPGAAGAYVVSGLAQEELIIPGSGGVLKPWLATSWSQPNPFTYDFHLRHGVKFSDGTEMTSDDVANSLNYWRYPGSSDAFAYTSVRSIKPLDRYTVRIVLKRKDATLLSNLANFQGSIFEKKFQVAHKSTFGQPGTLVVATGPFVPVSYDPTNGGGIEYRANPYYWGGKVPIQHVSVKFFADETSEALAFRAGDIDVAFLIVDAKGFASTAATKVTGYPGCGGGVFAMNTGAPPWNDVHVRRAVAYALNRSDIIAANGGYSSPNYYLYPPVLLRVLGSASAVNAALKSVPVYKYDVLKAKAELAKSAYPNGFSTTIPEISSLVQGAEVIAAELKAIGINATVSTTSVGAWFGAIAGPAAQRPANYIQNGCSGVIDPSFYDFYLTAKNTAPGGFNVANYAPASFDALIDQSHAVTNPAKRLAIYAKMLQRLGTDVPYVPLFLQDEKLAISSKFTWPTFDKNWVARPWAAEIKAR